MFFRQIFDPNLAQYAYLIGCQRTREAVVIDPERDGGSFSEPLGVASGDFAFVGDLGRPDLLESTASCKEARNMLRIVSQAGR